MQATTPVLKARSAILGDLQDNEFVAVLCGTGALATNTYALAKSGRLCLFDNKRILDKFTEVKVRQPYIYIYIAPGCCLVCMCVCMHVCMFI